MFKDTEKGFVVSASIGGTLLAAMLIALAFMLPAYGEDRTGQPEILTTDRQGNLSDTNVVANVAEFAEAKAQERITEEAAKLAHAVGTNCTRIVDEGIAEMQRGAKIEYSDGFVWSVGAFSISSNAACNISSVSFNQSTRKTIDGVQHFAADFNYWFTEDIGAYVPEVRYMRNINATNSWVVCEQEEPVGPYATNITPVIRVDYAYSCRTWIPVAYASAFFKVFVDSAAPGTGATIDIIGRIKGGFTGDLEFELKDGSWLVLHVEEGLIVGWEVQNA